MRGGLDDALDKLARRDELRRRAANEATGTPAAVTELVEAIAAVVGRHPRLGVTVGVEGDGDPMLFRFYYEDGQVQVTAENNLAPQPRADFDVEVGEPVDDFAQPAYPAASQDDQDRFGAPYGYEQPGAHHQPAARYGEHDTAERRYGAFDQPPAAHAAAEFPSPSASPSSSHSPSPGFGSPEFASPEFASSEFAARDFPSSEFASSEFGSSEVGESSRDLGARMRDLGMASSRETPPEFPPHPLAPTPPPTIPPQTTRRLGPEHYRVAFPPAAADRAGATERLVPPPPAEQRVMPTPLPEPIPLKVERPEETEQAARRLAALLRDDPTLLSQRPD